jgi:hypothetical protein
MIGGLTAVVPMMLLFAAMALPADAQSIMDGSGDRLDDGVADRVVAIISRDFFEPESARFYSLGYLKKADGYDKNIVCGYLNGKNRMGGYVGIEPFFFDIAKSQTTTLPNELKPQATETFFEFVEAMGCPRP